MTPKTTYLLTVLLSVLALCVSQARAVDIVFTTDGVIEAGDVYDTVRILNDATVDMTGGYVTDYVTLTDTSTLNLSGGWVNSIEPNAQSTLNISGGWVGSIEPNAQSTLCISGGDIDKIQAYGSSAVKISGGYIEMWVDVWDSAALNFSGGSIDGLFAGDSSTVNITGGSLEFLAGWDSSLVNIYKVELTDGFDLQGAMMNIYGGNVSGGRKIYLGSTLNIMGGYVTTRHLGFGCSGPFRPVHVYGYDFNYDPNASLFTSSLLYGGQVTLEDIWPEQYECLNLVAAGAPHIPSASIRQTVDAKVDMLTLINDLLDTERHIYNALDEVLQSADWAGLNKPEIVNAKQRVHSCLLYTSPSPRDRTRSRMPSSA